MNTPQEFQISVAETGTQSGYTVSTLDVDVLHQARAALERVLRHTLPRAYAQEISGAYCGLDDLLDAVKRDWEGKTGPWRCSRCGNGNGELRTHCGCCQKPRGR